MATTADRMSQTGERTDAGTARLIDQTCESVPPRLDLLDDEYTREILVALYRGPQRGRELTATCGASRSTVYRRLDRLQAAGFVTTETVVDPDGHHCDAYRLARDQLTVRIDVDGLTVTVQSTGAHAA